LALGLSHVERTVPGGGNQADDKDKSRKPLSGVFRFGASSAASPNHLSAPI
jgi:hypothetical protein